MTERYTQLSVDKTRLYIPESPVVLEAQALLKDNVTGETIAQLKFKNISHRVIKALTVGLKCFDVMGNELKGINNFQILDLNAERDDFFGQAIAIPLPDKNTRSFKVLNFSIVYQGDSIWVSEDDIEWEELPEKKKLSTVLGNTGLSNQYRRDITDKAIFYPWEHEDLWCCTCGFENQNDEITCHNCFTPKEQIFKGLDVDILEKHKQEYEAKLEEERAAREAEKKAKQEQKRAWVRSHKKAIIAAIITLIIACILMGVAWFVALPSKAFAIYSDSDKSLTFYDAKFIPTEGTTYEGKIATSIYEGIEEEPYDLQNHPGWVNDGTNNKVEKVVIKDRISPISCSCWFSNMYKCTSIDVSKLNTDNCTDFSMMFAYCTNLTSLDLSSFRASKGESFHGMFKGCNNLNVLDMSHSYTFNANNMTYMFSDCTKLKTLDIRNFYTSQCTSFSNMFSGCENLHDLDVSNFDTSNCTSFSGMFKNCKALQALDVSLFNTSNAKVFGGSDKSGGGMFEGCKSLTSLNGAEKWNTSKSEDFRRMFKDCSALKLDCQNWNTSRADSPYDYSEFNTDAPGVTAPKAFSEQTESSDRLPGSGTGIYGGGKLYGRSTS